MCYKMKPALARFKHKIFICNTVFYVDGNSALSDIICLFILHLIFLK